jgi:hypothetical protein
MAFEHRKYVIKPAYNKQHAIIRRAFVGLFVVIATVVTDTNHSFFNMLIFFKLICKF